MKSLEGRSFSDPDNVTNPYPFFQLLREKDPVHLDAKINTWLVTRHADIVTVARNTEVYSDEIKVTEEMTSPFRAEAEEYMRREGFSVDSRNNLKVDGELHRRRRSLVAHAFSPAVVATMTDRVATICRDRVAGFAGSGEVDLIGEYAALVPIAVISDTLGLPDRLDDIRRGADSLVAHAFGGGRTREEALGHAENLVTLMRFARDTIDDRRENPRQDLISHLIHSPQDDPNILRLSDEELLSIVTISIAGGVDTTRNGIGFAMHALVTQPGLLRRIRESKDQEGDIARLCEEVLRFYTPVPALPRVVSEDTELNGKKIPKGAIVFLCWASGNRDAEVFADPDTFDMDRSDARRHLTFGIGVHHCLGAHLARNEIKCAIREFVNRVESIELLVPERDLDFSGSLMMLRGLKSLPVRLRYSAA